MLCYQCGSTLGSGKYCLRCGADVGLYRRIVRLSNSYYNMGLQKAAVRDLSGAVEALSRSLELDKRNIQARNLLGLVFYEMGETADALTAWVLSTHFQAENNPAGAYIEQVRENQNEFSNFKQGIEKYNLGLDYARHGSEDLAVIQLQRVTQLSPHMVKARALLAVLEYWEGRYDKAEKECRAALKIDRGNTFCQNILSELTGRRREQKKKGQAAILARKEALANGSEKAPEPKIKLSGPAVFWLRFGFGMLMAVFLFLGILHPTVSRQRSSYGSRISALYSLRSQRVADSITQLEKEKKEMEQQLREIEAEMAEVNAVLKGQNEQLAAAEAIRQEIEKYETVLSMFRLDPEKDAEALLAIFNGLKDDRIDTEGYRAVYSYWKKTLGQEDGTDTPQG